MYLIVYDSIKTNYNFNINMLKLRYEKHFDNPDLKSSKNK